MTFSQCAERGLALRGSEADRLGEMEKESWEDYRWQKHRQSLMEESQGADSAVKRQNSNAPPKTALAHQLRKEALGLVEKVAEKKSMRVVKRSESEQKQAKERHLKVVQNY